jgi:hypothetical protein
MGTGAGSDADRYRDVAQRLHAIAKPMRVLSALRWPASVRDEFLAGGGDALPSVEYPSFDEQPMVEAVRDVRRSIYPGELIDDWLLMRFVDVFEEFARDSTECEQLFGHAIAETKAMARPYEAAQRPRTNAPPPSDPTLGEGRARTADSLTRPPLSPTRRHETIAGLVSWREETR